MQFFGAAIVMTRPRVKQRAVEALTALSGLVLVLRLAANTHVNVGVSAMLRREKVPVATGEVPLAFVCGSVALAASTAVQRKGRTRVTGVWRGALGRARCRNAHGRVAAAGRRAVGVGRALVRGAGHAHNGDHQHQRSAELHRQNYTGTHVCRRRIRKCGQHKRGSAVGAWRLRWLQKLYTLAMLPGNVCMLRII